MDGNCANARGADLAALDPVELATVERELEASVCRDSFGDFVARFWSVMTGVPYVANVATAAIVAALQAVADGRIVRLAIAVGPGCGKSTLLSLFQAWRLARDPSWPAIRAGHSFSIAGTESRRVRRLVESDPFRALFPSVVLRADESSVDHWATDRNGHFYAVGTDGALTGRRAREGVLDDPLNASDYTSKAKRDAVWGWYGAAFSTRFDGDRAPIICCHQRLGADDLIGRLLASGERWTLLELAAEFDPARRCVVLDDQGTEVWSDPRTEEDELLAPAVLSRRKLDGLRVQLGSAAFAAQYNQRPANDEGAIVKRGWWRFYRPLHVAANAPRPSGCDLDAPAVDMPTHFDRVVIACDLTFGSTKGDYAVAQCWGAVRGARYLLEQWRRRGAGLLDSVAAIQAMRADYPSAIVIIEKAAHGRGAIEELQAAGVSNVIGVNPIGNKAHRIGLVAATIEAGNALLPLGASWLGDFVEELAGATKHDDQQDATAYSLHQLNLRAVHAAPTFAGGVALLSPARSSPYDEPAHFDLAPFDWGRR